MDNAIEKRPGSPLASSSKRPRLESKVGIILDVFVGDDILEYHIYLLDIGGHGDGAGGGIVEDCKRQIHPAARVRHLGNIDMCAHATLCFSNSTLFLFEGFNPPPSTKCYADNSPLKKRPKSAYKCCVNFHMGEHFGVTTSIPPMRHPKGIPVALPLPDGKRILVFSTKFRFKESCHAFELFDPDTNDWIAITGFLCRSCWKTEGCVCYKWDDDELYTVKSYSFIDESHLFLQMSFGAFALDLNQLSWTALNIPQKVNLEGYFETVMGRYALAPVRNMAFVPQSSWDDFIYEAYIELVDIGNGGFLSRKDDASFFNTACEVSAMAPPYGKGWYLGVSAISIIRPREEENGGAFNTCVVQVESEKLESDTSVAEELGSRARVLIDVCCTDLATLQTNVAKRFSVQIRFPETAPYRAYFFTV